jgi:hypothetical protein
MCYVLCVVCYVYVCVCVCVCPHLGVRRPHLTSLHSPYLRCHVYIGVVSVVSQCICDTLLCLLLCLLLCICSVIVSIIVIHIHLYIVHTGRQSQTSCDEGLACSR